MLVASFHFGSALTDTWLVVAYVYCESDGVSVAPVHSALEGSAIIRELRELTGSVGDEAYTKLTTYSSPYWSFDDATVH